MAMKAQLLIDSRCQLSEGPAWDDRTSTLWWKLHQDRLASEQHQNAG